VSWLVVGLFFKCCIADNLALWMQDFSGSTSNPYEIWAANLIFGLRIYYDFAGYSLVALGVARALGVRLTLNFASPYCSTTIQEFWRRWHVTLSQWFRDYVYIPLGGSRTSFWAANIAIVFVISGVWHGAGWNFVLWGAIHGLFLIINRLGRKINLPASAGWLVTMVIVFVAWLCFYETRSNLLWLKLGTLFTPHAYAFKALREIKASLTVGEWVGFGSIIVLATGALTLEWLSVRLFDEPFCLLRRPLALGALVIMIVLLTPDSNNAFIYFAF
jgi:D-alanyl-lipoteichoic acid acyltransferase DltB (MBOAT superfamily)